MFSRHSYAHPSTIKTSRYLHKESKHSLTLVSFPFADCSSCAHYNALRWDGQKYKLCHRFICCRIFIHKKYKTSSVPSTSLLQLIAATIKHICFLTFHHITQNIDVIVSVPSYKNPFSTDRQYYAYKVPVIT